MIDRDTKVEVYLRPGDDSYEAVAFNGLPARVEVVGWSDESYDLALEHLKLALWSFGIDKPIEMVGE